MAKYTVLDTNSNVRIFSSLSKAQFFIYEPRKLEDVLVTSEGVIATWSNINKLLYAPGCAVELYEAENLDRGWTYKIQRH